MVSIHHALTQAVSPLSVISSLPHLEAEILLASLLKVSRSHLYAWPEQRLTASQYAHYQQLLTRRAQKEPIAYLTGHKEFWSLDLQVTSATLIPRPETELLVELALTLLPIDSRFTVIDLGTGSGAIALAIAKERPQSRVLATDNSSAALNLAQSNAHRLGLTNVEFLLSDWFSALAGPPATMIVSNPPYLASDDPHLTQEEIKYEPRSALVAAKHGLADIQQLIAHAKNYLVDNGWLLLEHGYQQGAPVRNWFKQHDYQAVETVADLAGLERVTRGQYTRCATPL